MKRFLLFGVVLIFALSGIRCEREDAVLNCSCAAPDAEYNISLPYRQVNIAYQCCDNKIALKFNTLLQDSRCPLNATCAWQGTAIIGVSINDEKNLIALELNKPIERDIMTLKWRIELTELTPIPEVDQPNDPNNYVARIKLTKI